jgi:SAM-dependent methyltransferase
MELRQANWNEYWRDRAALAERLTSVDLAVLAALEEWCGPPADKRFLEAGSGSGKISRVLARDGAHTALVDASHEAVALSRALYGGQALAGAFARGSIFHLPFGDGCFDVVWNEGVVEHFDHEARIRILDEMARVCRPGGRVITFAPYAGAHVYRFGKWFAEKRGTWVFGREEPLMTMEREFRAAGLTVEEERTIGFWGQIHFLSYIPVLRAIPRLTGWMESSLPFVDRVLPGYFLSTAGRKG